MRAMNDTISIFSTLAPTKGSYLSRKSNFMRYSSKIVNLDVFSPEYGDFGSYSNKKLSLDHLHLELLTIFQIWTISI